MLVVEHNASQEKDDSPSSTPSLLPSSPLGLLSSSFCFAPLHSLLALPTTAFSPAMAPLKVGSRGAACSGRIQRFTRRGFTEKKTALVSETTRGTGTRPRRYQNAAALERCALALGRDQSLSAVAKIGAGTPHTRQFLTPASKRLHAHPATGR
jgi:hypothetical protein